MELSSAKMSFPDSSVDKESACNAGDPGSTPELGRSPGDRIGYPLQYSWASLVAQLVKNLLAVPETWVQSNLGSIPGLGRSPGEGKGYPLQYSGLENSMDCIVHGDRTEQLSLHFKMEKAAHGTGLEVISEVQFWTSCVCDVFWTSKGNNKQAAGYTVGSSEA